MWIGLETTPASYMNDNLIYAPHLKQRSPIRIGGIYRSSAMQLQILHAHRRVVEIAANFERNLLINRLITFQSPCALSSVLSQPPEGSLVILICSEGSRPWKHNSKVALPLPAGPAFGSRCGAAENNWIWRP